MDAPTREGVMTAKDYARALLVLRFCGSGLKRHDPQDPLAEDIEQLVREVFDESQDVREALVMLTKRPAP